MPAGCWCAWWRQRTGDPTANRDAMRGLVRDGSKPGLLAYDADGTAVGWVSLGPRESFGQLMRSRSYGPKDEEGGVWSVVCFYIDPRFRRQGVGAALLDAAVEHANTAGAVALEAYPNEKPDYMGDPADFAERGFREVRRAGKRRIMRLDYT
jgi:GNAT superfamily N-acetyltransferase